ncbi:uncharacterized protein LOC126742676 isoform X2 [Anthonomus grandis grandis]|nr:uncharacterized protein LOC126742676 isoform X2 [Anthonomus grandis grandis]
MVCLNNSCGDYLERELVSVLGVASYTAYGRGSNMRDVVKCLIRHRLERGRGAFFRLEPSDSAVVAGDRITVTKLEEETLTGSTNDCISEADAIISNAIRTLTTNETELGSKPELPDHLIDDLSSGSSGLEAKRNENHPQTANESTTNAFPVQPGWDLNNMTRNCTVTSQEAIDLEPTVATPENVDVNVTVTEFPVKNTKKSQKVTKPGKPRATKQESNLERKRQSTPSKKRKSSSEPSGTESDAKKLFRDHDYVTSKPETPLINLNHDSLVDYFKDLSSRMYIKTDPDPKLNKLDRSNDMKDDMTLEKLDRVPSRPQDSINAHVKILRRARISDIKLRSNDQLNKLNIIKIKREEQAEKPEVALQDFPKPKVAYLGVMSRLGVGVSEEQLPVKEREIAASSRGQEKENCDPQSSKKGKLINPGHLKLFKPQKVRSQNPSVAKQNFYKRTMEKLCLATVNKNAKVDLVKSSINQSDQAVPKCVDEKGVEPLTVGLINKEPLSKPSTSFEPNKSKKDDDNNEANSKETLEQDSTKVSSFTVKLVGESQTVFDKETPLDTPGSVRANSCIEKSTKTNEEIRLGSPEVKTLIEESIEKNGKTPLGTAERFASVKTNSHPKESTEIIEETCLGSPATLGSLKANGGTEVSTEINREIRLASPGTVANTHVPESLHETCLGFPKTRSGSHLFTRLDSKKTLGSVKTNTRLEEFTEFNVETCLDCPETVGSVKANTHLKKSSKTNAETGLGSPKVRNFMEESIEMNGKTSFGTHQRLASVKTNSRLEESTEFVGETCLSSLETLRSIRANSCLRKSIKTNAEIHPGSPKTLGSIKANGRIEEPTEINRETRLGSPGIVAKTHVQESLHETSGETCLGFPETLKANSLMEKLSKTDGETRPGAPKTFKSVRTNTHLEELTEFNEESRLDCPEAVELAKADMKKSTNFDVSIKGKLLIKKPGAVSNEESSPETLKGNTRLEESTKFNAGTRLGFPETLGLVKTNTRPEKTSKTNGETRLGSPEVVGSAKADTAMEKSQSTHFDVFIKRELLIEKPSTNKESSSGEINGEARLGSPETVGLVMAKTFVDESIETNGETGLGVLRTAESVIEGSNNVLNLSINKETCLSALKSIDSDQAEPVISEPSEMPTKKDAVNDCSPQETNSENVKTNLNDSPDAPEPLTHDALKPEKSLRTNLETTNGGNVLPEPQLDELNSNTPLKCGIRRKLCINLTNETSSLIKAENSKKTETNPSSISNDCFENFMKQHFVLLEDSDKPSKEVIDALMVEFQGELPCTRSGHNCSDRVTLDMEMQKLVSKWHYWASRKSLLDKISKTSKRIRKSLYKERRTLDQIGRSFSEITERCEDKGASKKVLQQNLECLNKIAYVLNRKEIECLDGLEFGQRADEVESSPIGPTQKPLEPVKFTENVPSDKKTIDDETPKSSPRKLRLRSAKGSVSEQQPDTTPVTTPPKQYNFRQRTPIVTKKDNSLESKRTKRLESKGEMELCPSKLTRKLSKLVQKRSYPLRNRVKGENLDAKKAKSIKK